MTIIKLSNITKMINQYNLKNKAILTIQMVQVQSTLKNLIQ
jgi:hypothetical protein